MTSLSEKLTAALSSRDRRLIRRRLPEPPSDILPEIDFTSNDYLSLSTSPALRKAVLNALSATQNILGSGGSRLLVPSQPHTELESRVCRFFGAEAALLFNSGYDANVGFFSAVPQPGDVVLYDAHIHASVHDGMRLSRLAPDSLLPFPHNSVLGLRRALAKLLEDRADLKHGKTSAFIAVESLYSMDGTIAPLTHIVECVEEMLPLGNGYIVVDEAHATGIYGSKGRGLVTDMGLEKRVFARLHTFGKALASSAAVLLTTEIVKDYLLNYARSLVYTTTLPFANIVAINCSFDVLEDGTTEALSKHLLALSTYFVDLLRSELKKYPSSLISLPDHLTPATSHQASEPTPQPWENDPRDEQSWRNKASPVRDTPSTPYPSLPTPIIPILTPEPRALSTFLFSYASSSPPALLLDSATSSAPTRAVALHTKPIYPPTVPKGTARVRICLHAGHTREDVTLLAQGIVAWAEKCMIEDRRRSARWQGFAKDVGVEAWMAAKL
ncbi:PLP-dependent transferase [Boletus edulis]|uniref:Pyridoxal phosphate-dependent transferase n=1 Tax=Boletus edulis BED1 TaxID=1328754 RepID=A0AAD4BWS4_BOLED|nr:PLP-dependent transferase [Boletus edulis]KAF8442101.1 pyridoxal phosphate-dependent transferase [Boletus edulis BED1]